MMVTEIILSSSKATSNAVLRTEPGTYPMVFRATHERTVAKKRVLDIKRAQLH